MEQKSSLWNQYVGTFIGNLVVVGTGASWGWTSPTLLILQSQDTPLSDGALNDDQISWIVSLITIGGLIGTFLFGWICDKYGRKASLMSMTIPQLISWILIFIGRNVWYLYVSRFFAGLTAGGIFVATPLFVSEIADTRVRGALGSCIVFSESIGILLMLILGAYVGYRWIPCIFFLLSISAIVGLKFIPETPFYLVKSGKQHDAQKSLRFYKKIQDATVVQEEIEALMGYETRDNTNKLKLNDFTSRHAKRALFIGVIFVIFNQFSGVFAMLSYTAMIFEKAGSSMSPNNSAIVVGIIQLFGNYCATVTVDKYGRKFCMVVSTIGIIFGYSALGTYTLLDSYELNMESLEWIPLFSFSFTVFISSVGVSNIIFVVLSEIMPENIKEFANTVCIAVLWSCAFIVAKILPLLINSFEMYGAMYLFAAINVIGVVILIILQPETKGKTFAEIKEMFET